MCIVCAVAASECQLKRRVLVAKTLNMSLRLMKVLLPFLAAMSSSSSDNVTQSVRSFVRLFVRPWPFFDS